MDMLAGNPRLCAAEPAVSESRGVAMTGRRVTGVAILVYIALALTQAQESSRYSLSAAKRI